jgi:hypothetical protein
MLPKKQQRRHRQSRLVRWVDEHRVEAVGGIGIVALVVFCLLTKLLSTPEDCEGCFDLVDQHGPAVDSARRNRERACGLPTPARSAEALLNHLRAGGNGQAWHVVTSRTAALSSGG